MGTVLSRIQDIVNNEGITIGALERTIGASKGVLSRAINNGTDIQSKWIQILVDNYPQYSAEWLLTGRGSMLKDHSNGIPTEPVKAVYEQEAMPTAEMTGKSRVAPIPLVTETAAAGFGNEHFAITEKDVKDYYVIPKFRYCRVDFMIEVAGLSMCPHFNPGDVIACTILTDRKFLQWNRCHVIATREQGILVKRLMPSEHEGCLKAVSDNSEFPPFDIPLDDITGIALVVGSVGLE